MTKISKKAGKKFIKIFQKIYFNIFGELQRRFLQKMNNGYLKFRVIEISDYYDYNLFYI